MNNMPLISIIVPVYNVEKYLSRCLNSILAQTFTDFEIIAVDDGSPDNCGKILDEYAQKDERIKVIHKENGGLSSARNAGLDVAQGEYVAFVDSDDYLSDKFIEKLYNLIKKYNADISQCSFKETSKNTEISTVEKQEQLYTNIEMLENLYNKNYVASVIVPNKMYKKELFKNIRFPYGKIHEDEGTTYKLFYNSDKIVTTTEELYFYYVAEGSITRSGFSLKKLDYLDALRERMDFYKEKGLIELYKKDVMRFATSSNLFSQKVGDKSLSKRLKGECKSKTKEIIFGKYLLKHKIKYLLYYLHPVFMKII